MLYLLLKCIPTYSIAFSKQEKEEITETKSGMCVRNFYVDINLMMLEKLGAICFFSFKTLIAAEQKF